MKIKLTTPGYESFTGWIGDVQFVEGTSVSDVGVAQAAFVGAMHTSEQIDGETVDQDLTPEGQEDAESTAEGQEVTSQEQKDDEEVAEVAGEAKE